MPGRNGYELELASLYDRPFWTALLLSAVLHGAVLFAWKMPWKAPAKGHGKGAVTVTLKGPTAPPRELPDSRVEPVVEARPTRPAPTVLAQRAVPTPAVKTATPAAVRPPISAGSPLGAVGNTSVTSRGLGRVTVILVVDPSGRVGEIHWNELPAMTNESLLRLEARLRQRVYPPALATHPVVEPVDDLLEHN